jgi:hypothetical protein
MSPTRTAPLGRHFIRAGVVMLAALTVSCASSNKLAQRSEDSLRSGQASHAFEYARRALDKDPRNDKARADMTAAATVMATDWKHRVRNLAAGDSLQGADAALDYARFRAELVHYQVVLPFDKSYHDDEALILAAAANHSYRAGLEDLAQHSPKHAYLSFVDAGRYVPGFRDIAVRIPRTYDLAITRVAILPFANQTDIPGLSKIISDHMYGELDDRLNPRQFQFTRLVDNEQVYARMTVSQLEQLSRDEAIQIGRTLGVRRVVWGHFANFKTNSTFGLYHQTIYRHVVDPDPTVKDRDRYEEQDFNAVTRQREVKVSYEFEVIEIQSGQTLTRHGDELRSAANTIYTTFQARGKCDDYCLVPPGLRSSNPDRATQLEQQWGATFGNWTLSKVLLKAREGGSRSHYRPEFRNEFANASYIFPVFLDDLPSSSDMALFALSNTWKPVYDQLQALDAQEDGAAPAADAASR